MRKRFWTRLTAVALAGVLVFAVAGCRQKASPIVDDQAAARAEDEVSEIHYIDEEAIALADTVVPNAVATNIQTSIALVNAQRAAAGVGALVVNDGLNQAAAVRAAEASVKFSHTRPNGQDWWTVNSAIMWGENLAMLYNTADSVVTAWMNSPTHAANIMNPAFTKVGVAVYQDSSGGWYWAQEFSY